MSTFWQLNYMLFQEINAPAGSHPWFDGVMIFCANFLIFCWPLFLFIVWGIPLTWRRRSVRQSETQVLAERRAVVVWVGIACILAYGINLLIEQFVFEPRPFVSHRVHLLVSHVADSAFPSDHTAWSFAVVGMLLFALLPMLLSAWQKRAENSKSVESMFLRVPLLLLLVAFGIACSIGVARIYVGVHYPGDVLAGAIDGLVAASVVTWLRRKLRRATKAVLQFAYLLHLA